MTSELEAAAKAYRRAIKTADDRRSKLAEAMVNAARDGVRQIDIIRITGYARERVRQILREGGIEPGHDGRPSPGSNPNTDNS